MSQWAVLSAILPVLQRHLKAYAQAAAEDAALWAQDLRRRLLAACVALVAVLMLLMLGCAWLVGSVWNTPWRNPVLGALLVVFLVCAIIGAVLALKSFKPDQTPFSRLRSALDAGLTEPGSADTNSAFPRSITMRLLLHWTGLSHLFQ